MKRANGDVNDGDTSPKAGDQVEDTLLKYKVDYRNQANLSSSLVFNDLTPAHPGVHTL